MIRPCTGQAPLFQCFTHGLLLGGPPAESQHPINQDTGVTARQDGDLVLFGRPRQGELVAYLEDNLLPISVVVRGMTMHSYWSRRSWCPVPRDIVLSALACGYAVDQVVLAEYTSTTGNFPTVTRILLAVSA